VVKVSGAKNAALPILAATILTGGLSVITNLPNLKDVKTMFSVLETLGATIKSEDGGVMVDTTNLNQYEAPYELVKQMRASILVMGPLLARFGKAKVSLPGGCAIGVRPIDLHLKGLEKLGARVDLREGYVEVEGKVTGGEVYLDFPSVGATENLIMASTLGDGETRIVGAAKEPEIVDLANFLNECGAKIHGAGADEIRIKGVKELSGVTYQIIPDRIEAGTYIVAGAITGGDITVSGVRVEHLHAQLSKFEEAGVTFSIEGDKIHVSQKSTPKPVNATTMPYPGFPTDMQAQLMTLMSITPGLSVIRETIFENRFMHVAELRRMGANIKLERSTAMIYGVPNLSGAEVMATDLRASAALVLAGLVAEGETCISRVYHLDRGYEDMEGKLAALGAKIKRVKE
jgi:UDP-N-acetylglucosamine 1-carboxyvinyltransferase